MHSPLTEIGRPSFLKPWQWAILQESSVRSTLHAWSLTYTVCRNRDSNFHESHGLSIVRMSSNLLFFWGGFHWVVPEQQSQETETCS